MSFMEWNRNFELGVAQFDEHHQHLVRLLNMIYGGMSRSASGDVVGNVLNELIDYATYHFDAEEKWMAEREYSGLARHKEEHERFSARVGEIHRDYRKGSKGLSLEILQFLKTWLTSHILETDADYASFATTQDSARRKRGTTDGPSLAR